MDRQSRPRVTEAERQEASADGTTQGLSESGSHPEAQRPPRRGHGAYASQFCDRPWRTCQTAVHRMRRGKDRWSPLSGVRARALAARHLALPQASRRSTSAHARCDVTTRTRTPRPNLRQRFDVLAASGFRCDYCGASRKTKRLQVDHVIARANDGTHDRANLVAACPDCNLGKSDRPIPVPRFARLTPDDRWDCCTCDAPALIASTEEPVLVCCVCRFPAYRRVFGEAS